MSVSLTFVLTVPMVAVFNIVRRLGSALRASSTCCRSSGDNGLPSGAVMVTFGGSRISGACPVPSPTGAPRAGISSAGGGAVASCASNAAGLNPASEETKIRKRNAITFTPPRVMPRLVELGRGIGSVSPR